MTLLISKSPVRLAARQADPPQWKGGSFSKNEEVKRRPAFAESYGEARHRYTEKLEAEYFVVKERLIIIVHGKLPANITVWITYD